MTWQSSTAAVIRAMIRETRPFTTPISRVIEHDYGELEGSGSYVELRNRRFLLTNEHVAAQRTTHSLANQFHGSSNVYRSISPFLTIAYPNDVGICEISDQVWNHCSHSAAAIPEIRFASVHSPVKHELLFLAGYAGENSKFHFGHLFSEATPYLAQETELPEGWGDKAFHFALLYNPEGAETVGDRQKSLPTPPGLSGSVVWNTRYVEIASQGLTWSPNAAQVTGMVWGWPSASGCLLATKVEHFCFKELLSRDPTR